MNDFLIHRRFEERHVCEAEVRMQVVEKETGSRLGLSNSTTVTGVISEVKVCTICKSFEEYRVGETASIQGYLCQSIADGPTLAAY